MAQATPSRQYGLQLPPYTSGAVDPTYGCSLTSSPRRSVLGTLLGQRVSMVGGEATQSADDAGVDRIASTPLHEKQKYVSSRPPLTPTADQVAMSMLNLMRTPHTAVSQTQSFSLRDGHKMTASSLGDDDVDEYPDADCASIASSNIGVAFWPARCADSVMSSTSLRSNTLDLGPSHTKDGANNFRTARTSSQPPGVRDTNSRRGPFDRSSVLLSERDLHGQRKSVCRSVLAGLKNFRRSIAGASSAWLHRTSTTASFASSALNRSGRQASTNLLASPGILNRSASVDAAVCADTMLTAPSPLTSVGDLRASTNTGLHRPAPLAETDLELDAGSPTPPLSPFTPGRSLRLASAASIPPFSTQSPLTAYQSSHVDEPRALFPRSMTINVTTQGQVTTPNSRSLRNLFGVALRNSACSGSSNLVHATYSSSQSSLPLFRKNAPPTPQPPNGQPVEIVVATTEEPCHLDPTETSPYGRLGGSMVSLTSWDSVCTMDVPQTSDALTGFSNARFWSKPSKPKASTGSAVWETASHLGVSTTEESRRSFRLPLMKNHSKDNDEVRKRHKKREKRKLGPLGHLFHRPSSTTNILQHIDTNRNAADVPDADITMTHSRSIKSSASRRESLLRGIFSR
ncbi:unnamed protein product [Dicrocoelium dendriticum]|nr:unnamed protein product [Dicrocoelium dendriticum]